ncbi:hypothetical protein [Clostridium sp. UBA1056]
MKKFCKRICVLGVFILLTGTIIDIPKSNEHPPLMGCISSRVLL